MRTWAVCHRDHDQNQKDEESTASWIFVKAPRPGKAAYHAAVQLMPGERRFGYLWVRECLEGEYLTTSRTWRYWIELKREVAAVILQK